MVKMKNTRIPRVKTPSPPGDWHIPLTEWENFQFAVPVRRASPVAPAPVQMTPWFGIGQVGPFNIFRVTSGVEPPGH